MPRLICNVLRKVLEVSRYNSDLHCLQYSLGNWKSFLPFLPTSTVLPSLFPCVKTAPETHFCSLAFPFLYVSAAARKKLYHSPYVLSEGVMPLLNLQVCTSCVYVDLILPVIFLELRTRLPISAWQTTKEKSLQDLWIKDQLCLGCITRTLYFQVPKQRSHSTFPYILHRLNESFLAQNTVHDCMQQLFFHALVSCDLVLIITCTTLIGIESLEIHGILQEHKTCLKLHLCHSIPSHLIGRKGLTSAVYTI